MLQYYKNVQALKPIFLKLILNISNIKQLLFQNWHHTPNIFILKLKFLLERHLKNVYICIPHAINSPPNK